MIGKNHKGGMVTLAERKSRYVLAGHIPSKHAEAAAKFAIVPLRGKLFNF